MSEKDNDVKAMNVWQRIHYAGTLLQGRIPKDGTNDFDKYKYASHDGVVAFVRESLQQARLVLILDIDAVEVDTIETAKSKHIIAKGNVTASVINIDKPEDRYSISVPLMALDRGDKAVGKAISYAKKYAITAMIGLLLATGEDPDSDTAEITEHAKARMQSRPAAKHTDSDRDAAKKELWDLAKANDVTMQSLEMFAVQHTGLALKDLSAAELREVKAKLEALKRGEL